MVVTRCLTLCLIAWPLRSHALAIPFGEKVIFVQLVADGHAGDAEPFCNVALVSVGEGDGLAVEFFFEICRECGEGTIGEVALAGGHEAILDVGGEASLVAFIIKGSGGDGHAVLDHALGDGEAAGVNQGAADDIFKLADVAGLLLLAEACEGVFVDRGRLGLELA